MEELRKLRRKFESDDEFLKLVVEVKLYEVSYDSDEITLYHMSRAFTKIFPMSFPQSVHIDYLKDELRLSNV